MNKFEAELRDKVFFCNLNEKGKGKQAPWEAVMEYVIMLEQRVEKLERRRP